VDYAGRHANCKLTNDKGRVVRQHPGSVIVSRSYRDMAVLCEKEGSASPDNPAKQPPPRWFGVYHSSSATIAKREVAMDDREPPPGVGSRSLPAKSKALPFIIFGAAIAAAALFYYFWGRDMLAPPPVPVAVPTPAPAAPAAETAQHFPAPTPPEQATAEPLPTLDASDSTVLADLGGIFSPDAIARLVVPQQIIRNFVVTVDNLPREKVALRLSPVRPAGGPFRTASAEGRQVIAADNASRYEPYVRALQSVDSKKLVLAYGRLYPLFQKAYEDLGYPKGYFNDRLVAVIDHLLAAPEPAGPIALVTPRVQPQFADPGLEALSSGQKIMVRMGPVNEKAVKGKLREIRNQLTGAR
jgi:hypothetical protein